MPLALYLQQRTINVIKTSQKSQPSHFNAIKDSTRVFLRATDAESTAIGHARVQSKPGLVVQSFRVEASALTLCRIVLVLVKAEEESESFIGRQQWKPEMA